VLASPQARTIPYMARPLADYELMYSPSVETEAVRHQRAGQVPIPALRRRLDWLLVPDADDAAIVRLCDTDPKDRHVLAAAVAAGACFVMTANVRHFGPGDLQAAGVSAVHPGLFLSHHLTRASYEEVVRALGSARSRPPREPLSIHEQEVARHLPALFAKYRSVFGTPEPDPALVAPHTQFRGPRCVRCSQLTGGQPDATGVCLACRTDL